MTHGTCQNQLVLISQSPSGCLASSLQLQEPNFFHHLMMDDTYSRSSETSVNESLRTNSSSSTPSRSNIATGEKVHQFIRAAVNETSSESSSEPKVWKRNCVRLDAQLDLSARSEISIEEETSQSGNEEFSNTDNDSIAAVSIEEDLNYSIKRYCIYTCTPEHSTHDQAVEDIHSADHTSARTPRSYSSLSEEGKCAAATFHYSYDSLLCVM